MNARVLAAWSAVLVFLPAAPSEAQVIRRERDKVEQPAAPAASADDQPKDTKKPVAGEDDDILAPAPTGEKKPDDKPPEPVAEPAIKIGLVGLIPVGDANKPLADQVTAALQKEFGSSKVFAPKPLAVGGSSSAQKSADDEAAAKAALIDGDDKLKKGKALLAKLQFGKARAAFEQALASFEKAAPVLETVEPLFFARVGLAEVAARQGQEDESATQLAAASVLDPERELDAKSYPPLFIRTHQKVRTKAMSEPRGSIFVDATGAGSAALLDGRETLGVPVKLLEVPAGRHLVRAVRDGLPDFGTVVDVPAGGEVTVSPGFLAKDGSSYVDALSQNKLDAGGVQQIKAAAAAAGMKGALVGVVSRNGGAVPVQLLYVDADGAGVAKLPTITFQSDLLDISIESLKARERAEELAEMGGKKPAGTYAAAVDVALDGAAAGAAIKIAEMKMRYDVKAAPVDRSASRVLGAEPAKDDNDGRSVLSAGKTGTRQRLDDEDDPYAENKDVVAMADPDAPITDQPWFLPVVIGAGVGAVVLLGGGTVLALVAFKVLPDPRPADKGEVHVTLP